MIDTNVLVSAAIRDRDPEEVVLRVVCDPAFEWVVSADILKEYREVLQRPRLGLTPETRDRWLGQIRDATTVIDVTTAVEFRRDAKDAPFIACALAADAEFLVSGDRDLRDENKVGATTVLNVAAFKARLAAFDRLSEETKP